MKDRVPTEVLENGAVRMEQFDASGNSLGYVYLKRADAPSEAGTPLCKNTLLTDETADALGLDDPTPNEAFAKLASKGEIVTFFNDSMTTATQTIDLGSNLADFTKLSFFSNENSVGTWPLPYHVDIVDCGTLERTDNSYSDQPRILRSLLISSRISIFARPISHSFCTLYCVVHRENNLLRR